MLSNEAGLLCDVFRSGSRLCGVVGVFARCSASRAFFLPTRFFTFVAGACFFSDAVPPASVIHAGWSVSRRTSARHADVFVLLCDRIPFTETFEKLLRESSARLE